jgi:hypothetical protein
MILVQFCGISQRGVRRLCDWPISFVENKKTYKTVETGIMLLDILLEAGASTFR